MPVELLDAARTARLRALELTYAEVGETAGDTLPKGYHHLRASAVIGSGENVFQRAARDVLGWQVQLRSGLTVAASSGTAAPGVVGVIGIGFGPLRLAAPLRVVYVLDEERRRGFGYGTLPGHPESGEEAFLVEHHPDGTVTLSLAAFSRHATALAKLAGRASRVLQRYQNSRYLRTLS